MISNEGLMREVGLRKSCARKFAMDVLKVFCGFSGSDE